MWKLFQSRRDDVQVLRHVEKKIARDPARRVFRGVALTNQNGAIVVHGRVRRESEKEQLMNVVYNSLLGVGMPNQPVVDQVEIR